MKRLVVVVFDQVAQTCVSPLMEFSTKDHAVRSYVEAVTEGKGFRQAHARDHELRLVGMYDPDLSVMEPVAPFEIIARGVNLFAPSSQLSLLKEGTTDA